MGEERRSLPPIIANAQEARARYLALRSRRRPALGGRGDGLLGQRDRGGRPLPRSVLLSQEADLLGAARRGLLVGGDPRRLSPPRGVRPAAPDLRVHPPGAVTGLAVRLGVQLNRAL